MPQTLAELEKGHSFPPAPFALTDEWVNEYIAAVDDHAAQSAGAVPPMALAALSIRALLDQSGLPPGAIHVAQELSFGRPIAVGETLSASAEVTSRGERQGWILMGVALKVEDGSQITVMDGKATITFPLDPSEAN
jgi:acyl dehydratase